MNPTPREPDKPQIAMVRRRALLLAAGAVCGWTGGSAQARPAKLPTIGVLMPATPAQDPVLALFLGDLGMLGYVDGRTVNVEIRSAHGDDRRLPALAAELVHDRVDLIVARMTPAVVAAKDATRSIPIVMMGVGDPVGTGLVASLARPGGNITGVAGVTDELAGKNLELLKEILPSLDRAAALCNPLDPFSVPFLANIKSAGHALGVAIVGVTVAPGAALESAFAAMHAQQVAAAVVQPSLPLPRVAALALQHHLPTSAPLYPFAGFGGLMAYVTPTTATSRQTAMLVDKVLKGRLPGDLPVEQPTEFELVINLRTAKALGLTVPRSLLARAAEIIE